MTTIADLSKRRAALEAELSEVKAALAARAGEGQENYVRPEDAEAADKAPAKAPATKKK